MKISTEWLREFVELPDDLQQLRQDISMAGLVVESATPAAGTTVLELEITSNRPDCLSYRGIAREIAALYGTRVRAFPGIRKLILDEEQVPFSIEIRDPDLCPRYVGLVMDRVRVAPSPEWMQRHLIDSGLRPVNNIVDITNYVLLELGHPLHAFDFDRLHEGRIVVARAAAGQKMVTLDGIERTLDEEMLLIRDGAGPVAIAGVMGGLHSEIHEGTSRVLLECAYFQPRSVRRTSKKLGLTTEASYRFERGADWDCPPAAVTRTAYLMRRLAGARVAGNLRDVYPAPLAPAAIELNQARTEALLGVRLSPAFITGTLRRLQCRPVRSAKGTWKVQCPTFRPDLEMEADLIEEIARFHGYQNIPATVPPATTAGKEAPGHACERSVRGLLLGMGYTEVVNLSFAGAEETQRFPVAGGEALKIRNPLTEETQYLRGFLAPGLLRTARHNFHHHAREVRIFEIGRVFRRDPGGDIRERTALGILGTGGLAHRNWRYPDPGYDFFHLKGAVAALLDGMRCAPYEIVPESGIPWLSDAAAGALLIDGRPLGWIGVLHPEIEEELKLKQPVYLAEIDFQELSRHLLQPVAYAPLARFPGVDRDLSIVVSRETSYGKLSQGIRNLRIAELSSLELLDVYEGDPIPEGKVGMTLRLTFLDREGTLTVDRVQGFSDTIRNFLAADFGAELR